MAKAGNSIAAKIAIMAITTSNSISVNAALLRFREKKRSKLRNKEPKSKKRKLQPPPHNTRKVECPSCSGHRLAKPKGRASCPQYAAMENGAQIFRIEEDHFKTQIFTDLSVPIRVFGSLLG